MNLRSIPVVGTCVGGSSAARVSDSQSRSVESELGLHGVDVPTEDRPVRAILHLYSVSLHVDRRVGVVALQGGDRLDLLHLRDRSSSRDSGNCKDDASFTHAPHLTAPCTIF